MRAPSAEDIERIAEAAFETIPPVLRKKVQDVVIRVEDFPDPETERAMELESPFDLLGLYHGVSLVEKSVSDVRDDVDKIFLYRRGLLDYWCETGEELDAIIRHVLIHEIGHHFGFSDEDMEQIEAED
jgi:predicted Zn-dependent protease with MMP-like domain